MQIKLFGLFIINKIGQVIEMADFFEDWELNIVIFELQVGLHGYSTLFLPLFCWISIIESID